MSPLFVATPCYRGDSKQATAWAREMSGWWGEPRFSVHVGNPYIDCARTELVADFLATDAEAMLFRDDDMFFAHETVERMTKMPADVVVVPYLLRTRPGFDVRFDNSGMVLSAGLGACLIRRRVLEQLWILYRDMNGYKQRYDQGLPRELVNIFDSIYAQCDDGVELYKEDTAFFHRVRSAGWKVMALEGQPINHAGKHATFRRVP